MRFRRKVKQRQHRAAARQGYTVPRPAGRKQRLLVPQFGRRIVAPLHVGAKVSGELNDLAGSGEDAEGAALSGRRDFDGRAQKLRVGHLGRHRPLPDQFVHLGFVPMKATSGFVGSQREVRRPDRLVRFLRVLDLFLIAARTAVILVPVHFPDRATQFLQRLLR